jgi:hypothetical protein
LANTGKAGEQQRPRETTCRYFPANHAPEPKNAPIVTVTRQTSDAALCDTAADNIGVPLTIV